MPIFTPEQRRFLEATTRLMHANPFLPERIDWEREALGDAFEPRGSEWNVRPTGEDHPNVRLLLTRCGETLEAARARLETGESPDDDTEAQRYEELVMLVHYYRYRQAFDRLVSSAGRGGHGAAGRIFRQFRDEVRRYAVRRLFAADDATLAHWFACFFQVRRAFANIFDYILGVSEPAVQLRAAVWQSIFTHDMRRYRRILYDRMHHQATLITGPSGTGKELVARAIGMSQYIPFDVESGRFSAEVPASFAPLHLAALSPTLIESELFGHCRGAFTGAVADRIGWLENCPPGGTVFLDELGELESSLQVKLLRVLQERTFSRLGETRERTFHGKIIAASHRDLTALIREGRFRLDLYYRLCSDIIRTPSLQERIRHDDRELNLLLRALCRRLVDDEAPQLAAEVREWGDRHLPPDYPWPGNVRELDQCIRNVMIRRHYQPVHTEASGKDGASSEEASPGHRGAADGRFNADGPDGLAQGIETVSLTANELLIRYCTFAYARLGSYQRVAQALGLDRRTVRARIDEQLLERLRQTDPAAR